MDGLSAPILIDMVKILGLPGLLFIVWYFGERSHEKTRDKYAREMVELRSRYERDMAEVRGMYENNVILVERFIEVSRDFKEVVLLNAQTMQRLTDDINKNQYCPQVRLRKEADGRQV